MTRLDELIAMREQIDSAIARERKSLWAVAYLRDEVEEILNQHSADTAAVLNATALTFGVTVADIIGRARDGHIVDARHVAGWVLHDQGNSYPAAGRILQRDHTTVLYGCRRVQGDARLGTVADSIRAGLAKAQRKAS